MIGDTDIRKFASPLDWQESTIGAAFLTQTVSVNDVTVKFEIWDTAGQERYHSLAPMYYRGAAAAIIVYDITNTVWGGGQHIPCLEYFGNWMCALCSKRVLLKHIYIYTYRDVFFVFFCGLVEICGAVSGMVREINIMIHKGRKGKGRRGEKKK